MKDGSLYRLPFKRLPQLDKFSGFVNLGMGGRRIKVFLPSSIPF
jgi:hypothetical protein